MASSSTSADVVLSFAVWLRRTRASLGHALWYRHGDLYRSSIWDIGDCGGYAMVCDSLYETTSKAVLTVPASHGLRIDFYDEQDLPPSRPHAFESITARFPLAGSQRRQSCPRKVKSGDIETTCGRCGGEGEVLRYTQLTYHWRHITDQETVLANQVDRRKVRGLLRETVADGDAIAVQSFEPEEVIAKLGYADKRLAEIAREAQALSQCHAKGTHEGMLLRQEQRWSYVPLAFLNVHLGEAFGQFFSAGRGQVQNILPPPRAWCPWRSGFWLTSAIVAIIAGLQLLDQPPLPFSPLMLLLPGLLLPLAIWAFTADRGLPGKPLWLVQDDGEGAGWRFCAALTKHWAQERVAAIEDPYYTVLFAEDQVERRGRSSFMCRLKEQGRPQPRELELLYLSPGAVAQAPEETAELVAGARRLIWVSRKAAEALDREVARWLDRLGPESETQVWLVGDGQRYQREDFKLSQAKLDGRLHLLELEPQCWALTALDQPFT